MKAFLIVLMLVVLLANQGGLFEGLEQIAYELLMSADAEREKTASSHCHLKFSNGDTTATKSHTCLKVFLTSFIVKWM